jgi:hypothetical protein
MRPDPGSACTLLLLGDAESELGKAQDKPELMRPRSSQGFSMMTLAMVK